MKKYLPPVHSRLSARVLKYLSIWSKIGNLSVPFFSSPLREIAPGASALCSSLGSLRFKPAHTLTLEPELPCTVLIVSPFVLLALFLAFFLGLFFWFWLSQVTGPRVGLPDHMVTQCLPWNALPFYSDYWLLPVYIPIRPRGYAILHDFFNICCL